MHLGTILVLYVCLTLEYPLVLLRHLKLDLKGGSQIEEKLIPDIIQNTQFGKCESQDCQKIFIAAKSLSTQNQCLTKHIKGLEKKVQHLEAELKRGGSSSASGNFPFADKNDSKDGLFMLGPTQWRCITNRTTKGRNWTQKKGPKPIHLKHCVIQNVTTTFEKISCRYLYRQN